MPTPGLLTIVGKNHVDYQLGANINSRSSASTGLMVLPRNPPMSVLSSILHNDYLEFLLSLQISDLITSLPTDNSYFTEKILQKPLNKNFLSP